MKRDAAGATPDFVRRVAQIHAELGIAPDYGAVRRLPLSEEADECDLVPAGFLFDRDRPVRLLKPAAAAWERMAAAAADSRIPLRLVSGFRSVARQREIIADKLAAGDSVNEALTVVAAPGYSEHHTGRAADIGVPGEPPLEEAFEGTVAFRWLENHAAEFGFRLSYPRSNVHRIVYEPWHWCWTG